jgi:hypothetical protein
MLYDAVMFPDTFSFLSPFHFVFPSEFASERFGGFIWYTSLNLDSFFPSLRADKTDNVCHQQNRTGQDMLVGFVSGI